MRTSMAQINGKFLREEYVAQRKYEMLRAHTVDGLTMKIAAKKFGYSLSMFKKVKKAFEQEGLLGLIPKKRGPKSRYKVTKEVAELIVSNREKGMNIIENSQALKARGIDISQATVYRVLKEKGYLKKTTGERRKEYRAI